MNLLRRRSQPEAQPEPQPVPRCHCPACDSYLVERDWWRVAHALQDRLEHAQALLEAGDNKPTGHFTRED